MEKNPDNNPEKYRNPGERGLTYQDVYVTSLNNVQIHGYLNCFIHFFSLFIISYVGG